MTRNDRHQRPILSIQRSPLELIIEIIAALGVLVGFLIIAQSWATLPETIPIHFDILGKPNNWGNKSIIWMLPILSLFMDVGFIFLSNYPHTFNYPCRITIDNAAQQYKLARGLLLWMKTEMIWMFVFLDWQMIQAGVGNIQVLSVTWLFLMMAVIFTTVGFYMWQAYQAR